MKLYTRQNEDIDSFVEPITVFSGDRQKFSIDQLSPVFWPTNGKWKMRGETARPTTPIYAYSS
jgi:hypothetical protein